MSQAIRVGDRVQVFLNSKTWPSEGWIDGTVVRIDPYSEHRSFYWVELDDDTLAILGTHLKQISVLNPKHIRRLPTS